MATERPQAEVLVNGEVYRGWKSVRVTRSLLAIAGSFTVSVSDRRPFPILPGNEVEVKLGDRSVVLGYVDEFKGELDVRQHDLSFSGRDKTGDLVDACSERDEFLGLHAGQILSAICDDFGIQSIWQVDPGEPFDKFTVNPPETAWQTIERAVRMRGLLAFTLADSIVQLDKPGSRAARALLREGLNVKSWRLSYNHSSRFQTYIVKGQQPGSDDFDDATLIASVEGRSSDREITRYRPLIVQAEGAVNPETAQLRAEWEATVRAARGTQLKLTVPGWFQFPEGNGPDDRRPYGELWAPNLLINCHCPTFYIEDQTLLCDSVVYELSDDGGTTAELTMVRTDAYDPQPDGIDPELNPLRGFVKAFEEG